MLTCSNVRGATHARAHVSSHKKPDRLVFSLVGSSAAATDRRRPPGAAAVPWLHRPLPPSGAAGGKNDTGGTARGTIQAFPDPKSQDFSEISQE